MCTCIYFIDIESFDGEDMPTPPIDPSVDLDDEQDMPDAEDHEVGLERPSLASALVPPFARHSRLDIRLRMDLGDQFYALFVEAGVKPAAMTAI